MGPPPGTRFNSPLGTITSQFTSRTSLTLQGAGAGQTILYSPSSLQTDPDLTGQTAIVTITSAAVVDMFGFTVAGPGPSGGQHLYYGILVKGGATLELSASVLQDIADQPMSGVQSGIAVRVGAAFASQAGHAFIHDVTIIGAQKGGAVIDGPGTTATIQDVTVTGAGLTPLIAQNGIQVSRGAVAIVAANQITGFRYAFSSFASTGVLLFQAGAGTVVAGNTIDDTNVGIYNADSGDLELSGNTISNSDTGIYTFSSAVTTIDGNTLSSNVEGLFLDQGIVTACNNLIDGGTTGVVVASFNGNTIDSQVTLRGTQITGAATGIRVDDDPGDSVVAVLLANYNQVFNNGVGLNNTTAQLVDARFTFWGSDGGPGTPGSNPVLGNVDYTPPARQSDVFFTSCGDGFSWNDPDNWSRRALPGPGDDVFIDTGTSVTIVHSGGTATINSLHSQNALDFTGALALAAAFDVSAFFDFDGSLDLLAGAALDLGGGGAFAGVVRAGAGGGVGFKGGAYLLNPGTVLEGAGTYVVGDTVGGGSGGAAFWTIGSGTVTVSNGELRAGSIIGGAGNLSITKSFAWTGGTMDGSGATQLEVKAALTMSGPAAKTLSQRTLIIAGAAVATGGDLTLANGAALNILQAPPTSVSDGSFDLKSDISIRAGSGNPASINNQGNFLKTAGTGTSVVEVAFRNDGDPSGIGAPALKVQTGTLSFTAQLTQTGNPAGALRGIEINAGAQLMARRFDLEGGSVSGAGLLRIEGQAAVFGQLNWTGGGLGASAVFGQPAGSLIIAANAEWIINGPPTPSDPLGNLTLGMRSVSNYGVVNWINGDIAALGRSFDNMPGGKFNVKSDRSLVTTRPLNSYTINNLGEFSKVQGSGTSIIAVAFNNNSVANLGSGTVEAQVGTLLFPNGGNHASKFTVARGATIHFGRFDEDPLGRVRQLHFFGIGTTLEGDGVYRVSGQTGVCLALGLTLDVNNFELLVDQGQVPSLAGGPQFADSSETAIGEEGEVVGDGRQDRTAVRGIHGSRRVSSFFAVIPGPVGDNPRRFRCAAAVAVPCEEYPCTAVRSWPSPLLPAPVLPWSPCSAPSRPRNRRSRRSCPRACCPASRPTASSSCPTSGRSAPPAGTSRSATSRSTSPCTRPAAGSPPCTPATASTRSSSWTSTPNGRRSPAGCRSTRRSTACASPPMAKRSTPPAASSRWSTPSTSPTACSRGADRSRSRRPASSSFAAASPSIRPARPSTPPGPGATR
jgi:parallel beta-helix repeat protein